MSTSKAKSEAGESQTGANPSQSRGENPPSAGGVPATGRADIHTRVFNELVDFLYAQSARNRVAPTFSFIICAIVFLSYAPGWTLLVILTLQLGGTGISELLRRKHRRLRPGDDRTFFAHAYVGASAICGLSWGAAGFFWFVSGQPETQILLVVLLIGGVTGSLVSRSSYLPALQAFVISAGLPFVATLLIEGTVITMLIAALALVYGAGILVWGRGLNQMYAREAKARLINGDLVRDIEAARIEAEHRAEEAEIAREAAEAGARTKAQFLATMSHEVRTPLNGILGMANLLVESDLTDDQLNCLTVIRNSSNNLRLILEDVLDLARLDAGFADVAKEEFAPDKIALQVAAIMEPEVERKELKLDVIVLPGVPAVVVGDEKRCRQALLNLMGNAVKFTDQGKISIRVCVEEDGLGAGVDALRFSIRDTGIGIKPAMVDSLFDDFFQADQSSTRRHGGGGLGLALVKRIVSQMGGDIGVRSTPEEGSEFWFDMPLDPIHAGRLTDAPDPEFPTTDNSQLARLENAIGTSKTRDIVETSMHAIWQLAQTIDAGRRSGDAEAVARAAHDLKSTAGNIGLAKLQSLADRIEAARRGGDDATALAEAAQVTDTFAAARRQLVNRYPQLEAQLQASLSEAPDDDQARRA